MRKRTSTTTRRALRGRGRGAVASLPYEPWLVEQLRDPAEAAAYLEAVIEDGDQATLMLALRHVAQAQGGIAKIARRAKLTREATYKMLSKSGNPELRSLNALLRATGLRMAVRPISPAAFSTRFATNRVRVTRRAARSRQRGKQATIPSGSSAARRLRRRA